MKPRAPAAVKPRAPRGPKRGRPQGRFTQARRLSKLRLLLEGRPAGVTLEDLAAAIHVSARSVRRYLVEIDRVQALESLPTVPGGPHVWRIKPVERGRAVPLRRTQAYALLAGRPAFDALKGSALHDEIDLAHESLLQLAQRPGREVEGDVPPDTRLQDRVLLFGEPARGYGKKAEQLDDLFQAVAKLRAVRLRCREAGAEATFVSHPCALVASCGALHCIVRVAGTDALRAVRLDDVEQTEVLAARFSLPEGFDARAWVHGAFGVAAPGPTRRVVVEFDARAAPDARARKVHPTQIVGTSPDGRVRLAFDVPDLEPVVPWVLGFGGAARVVEPPELARRVRASLSRALARYGARPT